LLKTMMGFFMAHWVYILQSLKDNRYYIGETSDVLNPGKADCNLKS
jgi:predicted GIY-YIG superfamily endonuclease